MQEAKAPGASDGLLIDIRFVPHPDDDRVVIAFMAPDDSRIPNGELIWLGSVTRNVSREAKDAFSSAMVIVAKDLVRDMGLGEPLEVSLDGPEKEPV